MRGQAAGKRRKEKEREKKTGKEKKEKRRKRKKGEKVKGKRRKRRGGAGGIRGDGHETGVASTRCDAHEKREEQGED